MVAIIDYGAGNLFSVHKAFLYLGADAVVTNDASVLKSADHIVLPGVGAFGDCMSNLENTGLIPTILDCIQKGTPFLGICVGLQLLFEESEETPEKKGLAVFSGQVKKIDAPGLKIPHMGWNSIDITVSDRKRSIFSSFESDHAPYMYFVHSYYAVPEDASVITSATTYGGVLTASVARDNVQAVQFHPEKSGDIGLQLLKNFLQL
ncbi:imidazole glycerol phosphate synthase subunit HisH [Selenomonas sp. TAMA-11512]|uniref:imidazole glycerol phosphate synthase subunit HisH n=1 Tax=Selenomonas sp. TAMA-11512 TaxID=3095337 RepID=UPI0030858427|nr:imidazole glycerol phosphate synthase subunit HisH [Selenomonas sp. TAMA-11512]